jgi:hypothetical protein
MSLLDKASLVVTPNAYKASKLYSVVPNTTLGDMTVVRATTATRVNSLGLIESVAVNVPRIDYTNGSCPSLLVEPQRTNYVLYSEQFDNAAWTTDNATVTANNTIAPDGNLTADRLVGTNTGTYDCRVFRDVSSAGTSGAAVVSIWAKADVAQKMTIGISNREYQTFDLTTLWVRYSLLVSLGGSNNFNIFAAQVDSSGTVTPGTQGTIYIWGAQLEAGAYATSYIPTVASSVTRNADVISKTGISSLIGQTEGTIFVDANLSVNANERRLISVSNGTETQRIIIWTLGTVLYATFNTMSVTLGNFPIGIVKIAVAYTISGANTNYSIKVNNNSLVSGSVVAAPNPLNSINIGANTSLGLFLQDSINSIQLYKTPLTNTEITSLTTL